MNDIITCKILNVNMYIYIVILCFLLEIHKNNQQDLPSGRIEIESLMSDSKVELTDLETISNCVEDLHGPLGNRTLTEIRAFIKSYIKEIKVTGNEAILSYSMPMIPERIIVEKDGVLPIGHYGGR